LLRPRYNPFFTEFCSTRPWKPPCIAVPRDERWGRTYEGFGESPELASLLGPAAWWLPSWLRRLPALDVEGAALHRDDLPAPAAEPRQEDPVGSPA